MNDEVELLVEEVSDYCRDAERLERCQSWSDIDDWLGESATVAQHDYDNSLSLRSLYGSDLQQVKRGLMLDYVARNIARRFVSLRGLDELGRLRRRRDDGEISDEQYETENQALARDHARLYERLGL